MLHFAKLTFLTLPVAFLIFLTGCSALTSISSSNCAGCQNVREIQDAYASNPIRAESEYVGKRIRIGGKAETIDGKGIYAHIGLGNQSEIRLVAWGHHPIPPPPEVHEAWEGWVATHDIGDVVEAECEIDGIIEPLGSRGPAMVRTKNCAPVENDQ